MPLAAGSYLGPYEVVSSLGAGGMGEVYRARDSRLGREVAVKVIAGSVAENPDSLRRFELEARAVAALNHPHILSLHDVGTEGGTAYAVFELLEGETLRTRLDRGPLSPRKAVELAVQVCSGLAAAHARGIIHRDLKPANLFITKEGRAKILDFGLAKLNKPLGDAAEAPTLSHSNNATFMGTVGYVSPEQVREGLADARSDLFSLGATLYEMLSGRRAFRGDTAVDTLSAILNSDAPPMAPTIGTVPASLERVVRRCLEKNPDERFQSAQDLGFALEALAGSESNESGVVRRAKPPWRRWSKAIALLAVLAAAAVGGLLAGRPLWSKPIPSFKQLTFRRGWVSYGRFAPDGRTVYYAAAWDGKPFLEVFSTRTDSAESRALGLPLARVLSVSSNGQLAIQTPPNPREGFNFYLATLGVVPLGGGAPRQLVEDVQDADWTPDGRDLCILRSVEGELQIELPPGTSIYRPHRWLQFLRVSPTGRQVAFVEYADTGPSLMVLDLATRQPRVLAAGLPSNLWGLAWAPGGREVWFTAGRTADTRDILAVDLSGRQRLVYRSPGVLGLLDISADGRVLLHRTTDRWGVMVRGPGDTSERDLSVFDHSDLGGLSADGRTLFVSEKGGPTSPRAAIYLRRPEGGDPVRLAEGFGADLSPDGKSVLVKGDNPPRLTEIPVGPGFPHSIGLGGVTPVMWLPFWWIPPNGDRIAFAGHEPGHPDRIWAVGRSGGAPRPITPEWMWGAFAVSRDGRSVAINRPGKVLIVPVDGGATREIGGLPEDLGVCRWSGDGRSLFLCHAGSLPCEVHQLDLATQRVDLRWRVAPPDTTGITTCSSILPSEDGRGYAYSYARSLTDIVLAEGLR
jgi:eukaryotic-like serine/threonine-protein kinase